MPSRPMLAMGVIATITAAAVTAGADNLLGGFAR
jgi:hypothetical protein